MAATREWSRRRTAREDRGEARGVLKSPPMKKWWEGRGKRDRTEER